MAVRGMEIIIEVMEANERMAISSSKYYLLSMVETAKNDYTRFYNIAIEGSVPDFLLMINSRAWKDPFWTHTMLNALPITEMQFHEWEKEANETK